MMSDEIHDNYVVGLHMVMVIVINPFSTESLAGCHPRGMIQGKAQLASKHKTFFQAVLKGHKKKVL